MMKTSDYIPIILSVLKDWRVILTVIVMIFVMCFARYVANYRKKAPVIKKPKIIVTPTEEKTEETTEEETE